METAKSIIELDQEFKTDFATAIMDSFDSHIAIVSKDGVILCTNEAWDNFYKRNSGKGDNTLGFNYFQICHQTTGNESFYSKMAFNGCMDVISGKTPFFEMEYPCDSPNEKAWFLMKAIPLKHDHGGLIISHQNITEKTKAINALLESENSYQQLADNSPILMWMSDENGKCIYVNTPWLEYVGSNPFSERCHNRFTDIHPDDLTNQHILSLEKNANKEPFESIYRLKNRKGEYRYFMDKANPRYNLENKFVGYIGRLIDVHEMMVLKEEFKTNEHHLNAILDSTQQSFILLSKTGKIIIFNKLANESSLKYFGKEIKIGQHISDHITLDEHPEFYESFKLALKGTRVNKTKQVKVLGGKHLYFSFDYIPIFNHLEEVDTISFISTNVTETVNFQNQADESERRFMKMADSTPVLIWMTNETNNLIYVNQKLINYTGKLREKLVGTSLLKHIHPLDVQTLKELLSNDSKSNFETIIRIKHISQEYRFVLLNGSARFTKNGYFIGFIGTMVDITELLNTKSALEKTLKTISDYKFALDQFSLISITDYRGLITEVNEKFCTVTKYSEAELIGQRHSILNSGLHSPEFFLEMKNTVHSGKVWRGEILNKSKDGSLFWVDASVIPIGSVGLQKQFLSIYYEITDKKNAEIELNKTHNLFIQASNISKIGGWEYDIKTDTPIWSEQMYEIYGLEMGTPVKPEDRYSPFLPKDQPKIFANIAACINEGKEWDEEFQFLDFKGKLRWIRTLGRRSIIDPNNPKLFGIFQDITEQKEQNEERNKLIEDLVTKNKNLSQFTYIVSHNLRSPVANILGLTKLMKTQDLDSSTLMMVNHLSKSAQNLDETFTDLNEILSLKEVSMEKSEFSLDEVFRSITSSLVTQIEESNVEFNVDFTEINTIYSTKVYVHSILYNLISNSIKYRSPKRNLRVDIKSYQSNQLWVLSVKDNGLGIDLARQQEKLFGLYKRFHQHVEGKGLGLYLVKTQAETLGGYAKVFSEVDKGTEFLIYLPIEKK